MVVGDRLWLFSQPVNGLPTPIQSLLLSNVPSSGQNPAHYQAMPHSSVPSRSTLIQQQRPTGEYPTHPHFLNKTFRHEFYNKYTGMPPSPSSLDYRLLKSPADENGIKSNGLADLESRFGNNSALFSETSRNINETLTCDTKSTTSSEDIDCEEIEISDK